MTYCLDTSAILDGWRRHYSPDVFPSVWEKIEGLIEGKNIISPQEVLVELGEKDDIVYDWAKNHIKMFIEATENVQREVKAILNIYPKIINLNKEKTQADPYVVAVAKIKNCIVVTGESIQPRKDKTKIPEVCKDFNIQWMNILEMMRREGWRF